MNRLLSAVLASTACGALSVFAAPAVAQEGEAELETVVVTARRATENLQTVPLAVSAVTSEALERRNIVQAQDLQRVVPALTVTPTIRGTSSPQFGIRGQRSNVATMLGDPAVGVYFAEVGTSRAGGGAATMFDLESVQVLRGPQGTLFGRNNTGGAILITPRAPSPEFEGYVQVRAGDYDLRDFEAVLNVPLADNLSLRLGGRDTRRDGYLKNLLAGGDAFDINSRNYRASLRWEPTDSITTTTILTQFTSDETGSAFKVTQIVPGNITSVPLRTLAVADFALQQSLGFYEFASANPIRSNQDVTGVQNITTIELGDGLSLKNIIGWRDLDVRYCINQTGQSFHSQAYCGVQLTEQFSNELQLQGEFGPLSFIGGLFYFTEKGDEVNRNPQVVAISAVQPPLSTWVDAAAKNTSYSVFLHANYDLDAVIPGLTASGGVRWTRDKREVNWHNRNEVIAGTQRLIACRIDGTRYPSTFPLALQPWDAILPPDRDTCSFRNDDTFEEPTWDASLNYQATPDIMLYLAHRHGYRSGGFNTQPGNAAPGNFTTVATQAQILAYEPEKVDDIEIGTKTDFRLGEMAGRLNLAFYKSWYENIQRNTGVVVNGVNVAVVTNASKGIIQGAEAEFTLRVTPDLEFSTSYSYTDAKYQEFFDNVVVGTTIVPIDISDAKFGYVPKHQFNAAVNWRLPVPERYGEPSVNLSYYYQSAFSLTDNATTNCGPLGTYPGCQNLAAVNDSYDLWNLKIDWRNVMDQGFDVGLFVDNLTDEKYYAFGVPLLAAPFGILSQGVGAPRMWGVSLRVPFGAAN